MGHRVWIAGLALILGTQGIWAETQPTEPSADQAQTTQAATQTKTQAQGRLRRAGNPLLQATGSDTEGWYGSTAATSTEVLRRNLFVDLALQNQLVYCLQGFLCGDSCVSLMILNIADPANPKFVSRVRFHGEAERAYALKLHEGYAYMTVTAPSDNTVLYMVDVSEPSSPFIAGSYLVDSYAGGVDIVNSLAYVACAGGIVTEDNRVRILNVADPRQIAVVGGVPTDDDGLGGVRVRDGYAYASGNYLYTMDVSDPLLPSILSQLNTGYLPFKVAFGDVDSVVYVADYDTWWPAYWSAFTVVDVADPEQPEILSQFPLFGVVYDVEVQGHWAYVSHGSCGLQVFDVTNPAAPDSVARYEVPMFAGQLAVDDTILVLADISTAALDAEGNSCYPPTPGPGEPQEGDLLILSIADPTQPRLLGFYSPTPEDPTPVDEPKPELLPTTFTLYHNYPNPFNPGTMIEFDLPTRSEVYLTVYNLLGQQVAQVIETQPAGHHTMELDLKDQASGVYFYELRAGDCSGTGKMLLLK